MTSAIQPTLFPGTYRDLVIETRPDPSEWRPCLICRRLLKNPESIARGVGPICVEKTNRQKRANESRKA